MVHNSFNFEFIFTCTLEDLNCEEYDGVDTAELLEDEQSEADDKRLDDRWW